MARVEALAVSVYWEKLCLKFHQNALNYSQTACQRGLCLHCPQTLLKPHVQSQIQAMALLGKVQGGFEDRLTCKSLCLPTWMKRYLHKYVLTQSGILECNLDAKK